MDATSKTANKKAGSILSVRLVLGILISLMASGVFAFIWDQVRDKNRSTTTFDHVVLSWMHAHQLPWLLSIARALAFMGSPPTIVGMAVLGIIVGLLWRKVRGAAWTLPIGVIGAGIIIQGVKLEFHRPRPTLFTPLLHESGYSFPSGHSLIAVVVYGLLGYFTLHLFHKRTARIAVIACTILLIVLIGVSRPYVQVHYPTDVLAGWMAGTPWLLTCLGLHEVLSRRFEKAGEPVLKKSGTGNASHPLGT